MRMVNLTKERIRQAESIFDQVVRLPPADRRAALTRQCGDDGELRDFVERLIESDAHRGSSAADHRIYRAPAALPSPRQIGHYRIVRIIGEGGMGVVFEAEQEHPRRSVALKMLRPGLILPRSIERFEHEVRVLGQLKHPGIAQIIEAGTADVPGPAGIAAPQPFFAMELVEGSSLIQYAGLHHLTTHKRLELLIQVCDAVHHAHQKGVIHRDLKPDNILVNDAGQPKILDFGVARAVEIDSDIRPLRTLAGQLVGTIPYMSPEQLGGRRESVDIRSDVFSLGVVAFELLTGQLPFNLSDATATEAMRVLATTTPRRAGALVHELRGDLDAILMQALAIEPDHRFGSCAEFADDLRRFLRHEPVRSHPPTMAYRMKKLVRRNRGLVAGASLAALALIAGTIGTATYARREAQQATRAQAQADRAESILRLLREMLASADPAMHFAGEGKDVTVREVLDDAARRLQTGELADQPDVESALWTTICETYLSLGCYAEAKTHLEFVISRRSNQSAPPDTDDIALNNLLGRALDGLGIYTEAERLHEKAIRDAEQLFGSSTPPVARLLNDLGVCQRHAGRLDAAEITHRQALEIFQQRSAKPLEIAWSLHNLGVDLHELSKLTDAEPLLRKALQLRQENLPPTHPLLAASLRQLAKLLRREEKFDEAEPLMRGALEIYRHRLDPAHPELASALNDMAMIVKRNGHASDALPLVREALEIQINRFGLAHREVASTRLNLSFLLDELDRIEESEAEARQAMDVMRTTFGPRHQEFAFALHNVAVVHGRRGNDAAAEPLLREAKSIIDESLGEEHETAAHMRDSLGVTLIRLNRPAQAIGLLEEAVAIRRKNLAPGHTKIALSLAHLAEARLRNGDPSGAIAAITEALPPLQADPAGPSDVGTALLVLAESRLSAGEPFDGNETSDAIQHALDDFTRKFGPDSLQVAEARRVLGLFLIHTGRFDDAESALDQSMNALNAATAQSERHRFAKSRTQAALDLLTHRRAESR